MMTVGIKKKEKKNPAAKTSVDINIDCHIFIRAAKYSEKKNWGWGTRQQPQSTTNDMADW